MNIEHATFHVGSIDDQDAVEAIKLALANMNGIVDIMVDMDSNRVAIEFDAERIELETLKGFLEDAGYKVR